MMLRWSLVIISTHVIRLTSHPRAPVEIQRSPGAEGPGDIIFAEQILDASEEITALLMKATEVMFT